MNTAISQINLELSSICDKHTLCSMCGHQDVKINAQPKGYMNLDLLMDIEAQLPMDAIIQLHRDGDPLAYPRLRTALGLLAPRFVSIVTHGERLAERAKDIIGQCSSVTVSVIRNDPDWERQKSSVLWFLVEKADRPPIVQIKAVGNVSEDQLAPYREQGLRIIGRALHPKDGNHRYVKAVPSVPEIGVCLDFLHHPSIDIDGNVYICNRLDPQKKGILGNLKEETLDEIWNGTRRTLWLEQHMAGKRQNVPLCSTCTYWGIPVQ